MSPVRGIAHRALLGSWVLVAGCTAIERSEPEVSRVRVGVLPNHGRAELERRNGPLLGYLGEATDTEVELAIPSSYEQLLEWFAAGRVDLAWFGGLTFIRAEHELGARPLVMRTIDLEFTSDFLTATCADSIDDFAGKTFAFGPRLSTSGHLMPRWQLEQRGVVPEAVFGKVLYSAGHDQTVAWVQNGTADIGVVNSVLVDAMYREGQIDGEELAVLRTTAPYRNYVWAVRPGLGAELRDRLLDAFLALDRTVPEHLAILRPLGCDGFVPASKHDYSELREAAHRLGLVGAVMAR